MISSLESCATIAREYVIIAITCEFTGRPRVTWVLLPLVYFVALALVLALALALWLWLWLWL